MSGVRVILFLVIVTVISGLAIAQAERSDVGAEAGAEAQDYAALGGTYPTIAYLGDSNIWTAGEMVDCEKSWATWLTRGLNPHVVRNYARSGATITNTVNTVAAPGHYTELLNDTNTIYNQAIRLRMDIREGKIPVPDLIIVGGGTNDAWFADHRPGLFETDDEDVLSGINASTLPSEATTLLKSLSLIDAVLRDVAPEADIMYVGPSLTTKAPDERIRKVNDYMELVVGAVKLSESELIDPKMELRNPDMTVDGVHTSVKGARRIGEYLLGIMMEE